MTNYILNDNHEVVPVDDTLEWARWFAQRPEARRVALDELPNGVRVSTVFLGLDHRFGAAGPPLVFETMAFAPDGKDIDQWRYCTWDNAVDGHAHVVAKFRDWTAPELEARGDAAAAPIPPDIDDYDWEHIFSEYTATPAHVRTKQTSEAVKREDVERVIAYEDGENDGPDWVGVFKLRNGKFLTVRAGCDYTGWGCQEGGSSDIADTLEDALTFGLTAEERARLKLSDIGPQTD